MKTQSLSQGLRWNSNGGIFTKDKTDLDAGLEDILLYINIKIFAITKVATHPDIFSCVEVIGWILSRMDAATLVMNNKEKKFFFLFHPYLHCQSLQVIDTLGFHDR